MNRIIAAAAYAARYHHGQHGKEGEEPPYIEHPIAVADLLANEVELELGAAFEMEDLLVAALLHDVIEKGHANTQELAQRFGKRVCEIVLELSDEPELSESERRAAQVEHAGALSPLARRLKLADKICNLRAIAKSPPKGWSLEKRQAYFDWGRDVVDRLRGTEAGLEKLFDAAYAARP